MRECTSTESKDVSSKGIQGSGRCEWNNTDIHNDVWGWRSDWNETLRVRNDRGPGACNSCNLASDSGRCCYLNTETVNVWEFHTLNLSRNICTGDCEGSPRVREASNLSSGSHIVVIAVQWSTDCFNTIYWYDYLWLSFSSVQKVEGYRLIEQFRSVIGDRNLVCDIHVDTSERVNWVVNNLKLRYIIVQTYKSYQEVSIVFVVGLGRTAPHFNFISVNWARLNNSVSNLTGPSSWLINWLSNIPGCSSLVKRALDSEESSQWSIG